VRVSEVVGGISVLGVLALIGIAMTDNNDPATLTSVPGSTILAPQFAADSTIPEAPTSNTGATEAGEVPTPSTAPPATPEAPTPTVATTTAPTGDTVPSPEVEVSAVRVRVLNAGGIPGVARFVTGVLDGEGFEPDNFGDGVASVEQTTVLYAPGSASAAAAVNEFLSVDEGFVTENLDDPNWVEFGNDLDVLVLLGPA
jgi:hypothetical protein